MLDVRYRILTRCNTHLCVPLTDTNTRWTMCVQVCVRCFSLTVGSISLQYRGDISFVCRDGPSCTSMVFIHIPLHPIDQPPASIRPAHANQHTHSKAHKRSKEPNHRISFFTLPSSTAPLLVSVLPFTPIHHRRPNLHYTPLCVLVPSPSLAFFFVPKLVCHTPTALQ